MIKYISGKKILLTSLLFLSGLVLHACEVCEKQQPAVLKGIGHGGRADSQWDYVIVIIGVIIVALTLFYSIKWIFRPGERSPDHIKRMIFNAE